MRTKILTVSAMALVLAGCSQDELVSVRQDGIGYSVSAGSPTRAADSYCNNRLPDSFKVWATSADGLFINGDRIVRGNGTWTDEDGVRYWPKTPLDFYAEVNGDDEFRFNGGKPSFEDFIVKDNVLEQTDLMYSVRKNQTKANDKVRLNFRHALSQVCFKAKNNTRNMSVEIKGVTVGHLANQGTFTFPSSDTDYNYTNHNDGGAEASLNGGSWSVSGAYDNEYAVKPVDEESETVTLGPGAAANLTCPGDGHGNGFTQVLTLLPQTVDAWDPTQKSEDYNGAYFLVDVVLSNTVSGDDGKVVETPLYSGQAAIPVNVVWEQGCRYIYTFVFDEGGSGGYTPDPDDPRPILTSISYDVTVDDFVPVSGDSSTDGTHMDGGQGEDPQYKYNATLVLNANDGSGSAKTVRINTNDSPYSFTFAPEYTPAAPEGYTFAGWARSAGATVPEYTEGGTASIALENVDRVEFYAVWKKKTQTITLTYNVGEGSPAVSAQTQEVESGKSAVFTVVSDRPGIAGQYQFLGWSDAPVDKDKATDKDVRYIVNDKITTDVNKTIYAVYAPTTPSIGGGGGNAGWDN